MEASPQRASGRGDAGCRRSARVWAVQRRAAPLPRPAPRPAAPGTPPRRRGSSVGRYAAACTRGTRRPRSAAGSARRGVGARPDLNLVHVVPPIVLAFRPSNPPRKRANAGIMMAAVTSPSHLVQPPTLSIGTREGFMLPFSPERKELFWAQPAQVVGRRADARASADASRETAPTIAMFRVVRTSAEEPGTCSRRPLPARVVAR